MALERKQGLEELSAVSVCCMIFEAECNLKAVHVLRYVVLCPRPTYQEGYSVEYSVLRCIPTDQLLLSMVHFASN